MKRTRIVVAALAALFVLSTSAALAIDLDIPIDTVVRADEGTITLLATVNTPPALIGSSCVSVAVAANQGSVHPGNDLILASGDSSTVLEDVEREPGATTPSGGTLVLGPFVTVSLLMGPDEIFSGGIVVVIGENCTPPTTAPPTTEPPAPVIEIIKTATPDQYELDGIGYFSIEVTNPGPVDLHDVHVTDEIALAIDPNSDCANPSLPDLAVSESYTYSCSVGNLDGVSPFTNEATAIGTGPLGTEVTDTDPATVFPPVLATTITQPPTTVSPTTEAPEETLPVTGVPFEAVRGSAVAGIGLLVAGVMLLGGAAIIGRLREER